MPGGRLKQKNSRVTLTNTPPGCVLLEPQSRLQTTLQCRDTYPSIRWHTSDGESQHPGALDSTLQPAVEQDLQRQRPGNSGYVSASLDGPPTKAETVKAIGRLQTGKAPGPDEKPPEIFKVGSEALTEQLVSLFQLFWEGGDVPRDLKDANIVHLYENKGEKDL